jgi:hypothetical protein
MHTSDTASVTILFGYTITDTVTVITTTAHCCDDHQQLVQEWAARMITALERIEHTLYESEVQLVPLCTSTEGAAQLTALQVTTTTTITTVYCCSSHTHSTR